MRTWARLALAGLLLALFALVATGLRVESDLESLVPEGGGLAEAFSWLERSESADQVLVEVDGTGVPLDALLAEVDRLGAALEAEPLVAEVRYRVGVRDGARLQGAAAPHALELLPAEVAAERLSPEGMRAALSAQLGRLAGPGGSLFERAFVSDPLDLSGLALERLRALGPHQVQVRRGHYLHASGERAVLFVRPVPTTREVGPDSPLVPRLEAIFAESSLPVTWLGGHRIAWDAARSMRADVQWAALFGLACLSLVFFTGFRSLRPALGVLAPLSLAAAATLAAGALASPIHGINLGFASALLGLSLDYWIHLYVVAAAAEGPRASFSERLDLARGALRDVLPALGVGASSTMGAFALLALSQYPVVRDLGVMGAAASGGAFVGTVLLGPVAWAALGGRRRLEVGASTERRAWVRGGLVLATVAAVLAATGARFDGDPRHLIRATDEVAAAEADLGTRYGGFGTGGLVVVEGEGALDTTAALSAALADLPGVAALGVGELVPGPAIRARRRAALPPAEVLQARLDEAAAEVGFAPAAVEGAGARMLAPPEIPLGPDTWAGTPVEALVRGRIAPGSVTTTLVLDDDSLAATVAAVVERAAPGARLVLPAHLAAEGLEALQAELRRMGALSAAGVVLLLLAVYRRPRRIAAALLPPVVALTWTLGAMAALDVALNPVSLAALVLILGLGLDHGVFVLEGLRRGHGDQARYAVLMSAATTMAGFGVLVVARAPALRTVGLAVLVGLSAALAASLVLVPALAAERPVVPAALGRWLRRLALAALVLAHLDTLFLQLSYLRPPQGPGPVDLPLEWTPTARSFGDSRLELHHGVWAQVLEGSPWERGWASGMLTSDLQARLEADTRASLHEVLPSAAARYAVLRGSLALAPRLDRHVPEDLRLEIAAATAADDPGDDLFGPAYSRRVYYHAIHDLGQAVSGTPLMACTGFMAGGASTVDGHWLLGRNFDFEASSVFDRDKVVSFVRPDVGIPFASVSFANMAGVVSGLNAEGLGIALQASVSDDPVRVTTPMTLVARQVLQHASSLDEAEAILAEGRGFVAENVLVVDGGAGEAALFEVTSAATVRVPVQGPMAVANHFRSPGLADDEATARRLAEETTGPRQARMEELLARHEGSLDPRRAVEILRDQRGVGETPLAPGHRHALDAHIATHSVVLDATAGTLWVSRHPNAAGGYLEWRLEDGLAGRLEPREVVGPRDVSTAFAVHRARDLVREARAAPPARAEALALLATSLAPGHPEPLGALAHALAAQGRADEAAAAAREALAATPEYAHQARELRALLAGGE